MSEPSANSSNPDRWRSLTELHPDLPVIDPPVEHQFDLMKLRAGFDRRHFLEVMGASLALGGAAGCMAQPTETILPYAKLPEQIVPGRPLFFATTMSFASRSIGLLIESHEGRPTKVEGNPEHPASLGATDAIAQASILSLYDQDRAKAVTNIGEVSTWDKFLDDLRDAMRAQTGPQGSGVRILTDTVVSPTIGRQIKELLTQFPRAKWHQYDAGHAAGAFQAQSKAFGRAVTVVPHFDRADIIVSLDADFIGGQNGSVAFTRQFMSRRDLSTGVNAMNRLYLAETSVSPTGTIADHRLPVTPSQLVSISRILASQLEVKGFDAKPADLRVDAPDWINAVVDDLKAHRGTSLVVAGDRAPWQVHLACYLLNDLLGNVGKTVEYIEPIEAQPIDQGASIAELHADLMSGQVEVVLLVGVNPVYTAPADLDFAAALKKVERFVAQLSTHHDETTPYCHWHVPQTVFLESWSDARSFDGTASIVQPLIAPLYDSRSAHEFLSAATGKTVVTAFDAVRETWRPQGGNDFEPFWRTSVHDGVIANTAAKPVSVTLNMSAEDIIAMQTPVTSAGADTVEVVFDVDPTIWDGRFGNNGWLQELPKPWTRLTWGNAALISPAMMKSLGVREGDHVELKVKDRTVVAPVWPTPGHADGSITLHLGHGRKDEAGGKSASRYGFNANLIRTRDSLTSARGVAVRKVGGRERLACTQEHHSIEGRDIVRNLTLEDFTKGEAGAPHGTHNPELRPPSLYPDWEYKDRAWGMVIDLSRCSGCNACVLACQSENNIPVVGKSGVLMGREMHWLRIDRYFSGPEHNPQVLQQPMLCQHCEHAPCETVCPANATTHSPEGLNEMTYNRCVGTRYCSNNCPYKVRRFNFLSYVENEPLAELRANPDVTVRSRGVMEKCTYCVQRISAVRIETSKESAISGQPQKMPDGAVVTACQAVCPSQAIAFGDLNDKDSKVAKWAALPHNYGVLAELGTRPRTTYLSRVSNPNPAVGKADEKPHASMVMVSGGVS